MTGEQGYAFFTGSLTTSERGYAYERTRMYMFVDNYDDE